jgi:hypothetical protein
MSDNLTLTEIAPDVPLWINPSARDRYLTERLAELENFIAEDRDWISLGAYGQDQEFSRQGLQAVGRIARLMYIANPLINRVVSVKADYVWGRGINIHAKDKTINELVQAFLDDRFNQVELTSQPARVQKEVELQTDGNIFFAFIVHPVTGHVRVRTIPVDEIVDTITDPGDKKQVRYYQRHWQEITIDLETGASETKDRTAYYPDWQYQPKVKRTKIGSIEVINVPVYHVKVGGFSDWKFGVSEIHSALYWAKAYNKFLSNWASLMAVYARFALKITTSGGKAGIDKSKTALNSTITGSSTVERNPPTAPASAFIRSQNTEGVTQADVDVVRTAGATTSAEDGRRLLLMVCAAAGIPETFTGDLSAGNQATAKTLDRPTELGFVNRQQLWTFVIHSIIDFVIYCSAKAANGIIGKEKIANIIQNEYGEDVLEWQDEINSHVDVDFPSVVEHDLVTYVAAVKTAATLDGVAPSILNDNRLLARMMLTALGENDIDEILDKLYPLDEDGNPIEPTPQVTDVDPVVDELMLAATAVKEAITEFRESINDFNRTTTTNGSGAHSTD